MMKLYARSYVFCKPIFFCPPGLSRLVYQRFQERFL
jgi:hypothetical protein